MATGARAAGCAAVNKSGQCCAIAGWTEDEIAGLFRMAWGALHLADEGQRHTGFGPAFVEAGLGQCGIACAVTQRIGHRRFGNPVFENDAAGQLQGSAENTVGAGCRLVVTLN